MVLNLNDNIDGATDLEKIARIAGLILSMFFKYKIFITSILTEREDRTGEYCPEVVEVRTECSEVRTKTTEGQCSPVRIELARLVSSLLYGTGVMLVCFLLKRTSCHLNSKDFRRVMTRATQKEQAYYRHLPNVLSA